MGPSSPRRVELRAESHDEQHGKSFQSGPPSDRTLPGSSDRPNAHLRQSLAPVAASLMPRVVPLTLPAFSACALPAPSRARGIVPSFGSESISAKRAASRIGVEVCASTASSLSSFACLVSSCAQSSGTFRLADDGIERAVGVLRRTKIAQARVRFGSEAF